MGSTESGLDVPRKQQQVLYRYPNHTQADLRLGCRILQAFPDWEFLILNPWLTV